MAPNYQTSDLLCEVRTIKDEKVLLVTGKNFLENCGLRKSIIDCLQAKNSMESVSIPAEFSDQDLVEVVDLCKIRKFTMVLAIGGGSVIDAAKIIAILATNDEPASYFLSHDIKSDPLPIMAAPTTAGTGSEVTQYAVYKDSGLDKKVTIKNPKIIPFKTIFDPKLLATMPLKVLAETSFDAFVHCFEVLMQKNIDDEISADCQEGIKLITANSAGMRDENIEELLYASFLGGEVINRYRTGLIHTIANHFGYARNLSHGMALAIIFPLVYRYNQNEYDDIVEQYFKLSSFYRECNLLVRGVKGNAIIQDYKLLPAEIQEISSRVMGDKGLQTINPKPVTIQAITSILKGMINDEIK